MTPLLAEPLCYTMSYRYVSGHLYLGRVPASPIVHPEGRWKKNGQVVT